MNDFPNKVLVATDGSEDAALAASAAIDLSRETGAELAEPTTPGDPPPHHPL